MPEEKKKFEWKTTKHAKLLNLTNNHTAYDVLVNGTAGLDVLREKVHFNPVTGECEILVFYEINKRVKVGTEDLEGSMSIEEAIEEDDEDGDGSEPV